MFRFLSFSFLLAFAFVSGTVSTVEIIAHRGASADAPENSLSAMKLTWEQKSDAIELDLWLSKDGKIIVFHDSDTKRIGKTNRKISELTLAEAQALDVGGVEGRATPRGARADAGVDSGDDSGGETGGAGDQVRAGDSAGQI